LIENRALVEFLREPQAPCVLPKNILARGIVKFTFDHAFPFEFFLSHNPPPNDIILLDLQVYLYHKSEQNIKNPL